MKLITILILGAAVLATPAFAQVAVGSSTMSKPQTQGAMNSSASQSAGNASALASAVSSVPDTQKKYRASSRASDFQKEAEITRQLNQQIASAGGVPKLQE